MIPKTNLDWLEPCTIFLTRHGSHAYGLNTPTSDEDFKGICIPPFRYRDGFLDNFAQAEFKAPNPDMVIYEYRKFIKLAADANPSILEVLFTDESAWVTVHTAFKNKLLPFRDAFISKKARFTFSGYATSQLKRIQGHYRWLKNPPKAPPERKDFGLPDTYVIPKSQLDVVLSGVRKKLESWDIDMAMIDDATRIDLKDKIANALAEQSIFANNQWEIAARSLGLNDNFIELMDMENKFANAMANWNSFKNWQSTRNPKRAKLEAKFGYDCKHGMHLVRLLRMGLEILEGKGVIVKRPDRQELLDIRNGAMTYEQLIEYTSSLQEKLDKAYKESKLPHAPDMNQINKICMDMYYDFMICSLETGVLSL